jgi:hypothetical protein
MAVRTDDIAFGDLGQYPRRASAPDHPRNGVALRGWVPMVKVHRARREPLVAVRAGHIAQPIEEARVGAPSRAPLLEISRSAGFDGMLRRSQLGANAMAVGADDIAFADFFQESRARSEHGGSGSQAKSLSRRLSMIEVHLMRGIAPAAICTRDVAKIPEERHGRRLARADPLDFTRAISPVVRHVRTPLART